MKTNEDKSPIEQAENWLQLITAHAAAEPAAAWCSGCQGDRPEHLMIRRAEQPGEVEVYCLPTQQAEREVLRTIESWLFMHDIKTTTSQPRGYSRPLYIMRFAVPA